MKKRESDSPYREQKRKRRWIYLFILFWLLAFVFSPYLIDLFSFRVGTMDSLVFDRLEMEQVQSVTLTRLDDFQLDLTVEGAALEPVLDLLGDLSIRTLFPQRLPKSVDTDNGIILFVFGDSSFDAMQISIYENEYIYLHWTPRNRSVHTYYRITDGTLDYDTLAALFPQEGGTS